MSTIKANTLQKADGSTFPVQGVKECDLFCIQASFTGDANPITNFARYDNGVFGNNAVLGSGMTFNGSNHFIFPSTGIYRVFMQANIKTTSSYNIGSPTAIHFHDGSATKFTASNLLSTWTSSNMYHSVSTEMFVRVTNISTQYVFFSTNNSSNDELICDPSNNPGTFVTFMKLGEV
tara:strand:- start:229 stop:759 length:531 start_codon:yes stop_codon:yes gene_type:complete